MAERRERTEVDGRVVAWRGLGAGPPLLLINGYAASGDDWDPTFLAALATSFELICPDNPGLGGSEPLPGTLSVEAMAVAHLGLLDALGVEAAFVGGWSMGGYQSQALAEAAPSRVRGLALIGTHRGPGAAVGDAEVWRKLTDHASPPREQAAELISILFPPGVAAEIDRDFGEEVAAARAAMSVPVLEAQEGAMIAWRKRELPEPAPSLPAAVVHGALDAIILADNAGPLAERWNASLEVIDGCGHAVMAQEPQRVAAAIAALAAAERG